MKQLLVILLLCFCCCSAWSQSYTIATVTITNTAGTTNGQTITVNGDTRTWTNSVNNAATQILTNNTIASAAYNMLYQFSVHPFTNISMRSISSSAIELRTRIYSNITVSLSSGWGTLSYQTNLTTPATVLRLPLTVESLIVQTNLLADLVSAFNSSPNTGSITRVFQVTALTNNDTRSVSLLGASNYLNNVGAASLSVLGAGASNWFGGSIFVDTNIASRYGQFYGNGGGLSNIASAASADAVISTNITYPAYSFASATNGLVLNNDYQTFVMTTDCSITNLVKPANGRWATVFYTNSDSSAHYVRILPQGAAWRAFNSTTTNAVSVPAGKEAAVSVAAPSSTNYCTSLEQ